MIIKQPQCENTHKKGGQEDGCQGDQRRQHHLGGYFSATATHDGREYLKHHPDEEHEVDIRQGQTQQIEHAVLHRRSCRKMDTLLSEAMKLNLPCSHENPSLTDCSIIH